MNQIILKGELRNIEHSHDIGNIAYDKAQLIVHNSNDKESVITIKFKHFCNIHEEGDIVSLIGNVRSYLQKVDGKNHVEIYVFTYFDEPESDEVNYFEIEGNINKKDILRINKSGKENIHFTVFSSLEKNDSKLNDYLPCVAWGKLAKEIDSNYNVGDKVIIKGEFRSREYKKYTDKDYEIRVAHELLVTEISKND